MFSTSSGSTGGSLRPSFVRAETGEEPQLGSPGLQLLDGIQ
jgi:hypothetical protein